MLDINNRIVLGRLGFRCWQNDLNNFNKYINHLAMLTKEKFCNRNADFCGDLNPALFREVNRVFSPENLVPSDDFEFGIKLNEPLKVPPHWRPRTSKPKPNIFTDTSEVAELKMRRWEKQNILAWEHRKPPRFMDEAITREVWQKTKEECEDQSFLMGPYTLAEASARGIEKASGRFGVIQGVKTRLVDDLRFLNYHHSLLRKIPLPSAMEVLVLATEVRQAKPNDKNKFSTVGNFINERVRNFDDEGDPKELDNYKEPVLLSTLKGSRLRKEDVSLVANIIDDESWESSSNWLELDEEMSKRANRGLYDVVSGDAVDIPSEYTDWDLDENGQVIHVGPDDPFINTADGPEPDVIITIDVKGAFKNIRVTRDCEKYNALAVFSTDDNCYKAVVSKRAVFGSLHSIISWCAVSEVV